MLSQILQHFPAHTHALTLVRDPDGVLGDEALLAELSARGFTLVQEDDPVALRYRVEQARPWNTGRPLIVVTPGALEALPYDLWQPGQRVELALHTFFPNLAYPVLKTLLPDQRARLAQAPSPVQRLGRQATVTYLLYHVFDADLARLRQPAALVAWMDLYHQQASPLPALLQEALLAALEKVERYAGWPLRALLTSPETFVIFVREQWQTYIHWPSGQTAREPRGAYLDFGTDPVLQDTLPILVRTGTLAPVPVERSERLPAWARPALLATEADRIPRRVGELLAKLDTALHDLGEDARWQAWHTIAWDWAELTALRYRPDTGLGAEQPAAYVALRAYLDTRFEVWLARHYAPLAGMVLPNPHHLYHVPRFLAHRYPPAQGGRVALLVLDGMALADWTVIRAAWRARHPAWRWDERLVLAQVPTITAVSRQALVSGLRPADFADTLATTQADARRWAAFWTQYDLPRDACPYAHVHLDRDAPPPDVTSARVRALCLVETRVDDLVHDATLGSTDFYASLALWLESEAVHLESLIDDLLDRGFSVTLTSDHGHVEARGMGTLSEGLVVDTRSQRARLYYDPLAAQRAQEHFPDTVLWEARGILPEGVWVLIPQARLAFAQKGTTVMTHGGLTLDEVVVPLVTIRI